MLNRVNYHSFGPLLASLIKKNRIVFDMDDWEMREDPGYILGFYPTSKAEFLTRKIAPLADLCIASSLYLKKYLLRFNKNTYCVPSCVNTDKFSPLRRDRSSDIVRFCWVGTIHRREDIENIKFIVDCFKAIE